MISVNKEDITTEENIRIIKHLSLRFEPFMCDICNESFPEKNHLTHHSNQHKFECDLCKKMFTQKCSLKTHYLIHEGMKPYKCEVCERGFGDRSTLRKHSLIHSGARPHVCSTCNRSFVQKVTLRKHILTHTGEKAHACETCGRAFAQKSTLQTHYRTHSAGRKPKMSEQVPCIHPQKDINTSSIGGNEALIKENDNLFKTTYSQDQFQRIKDFVSTSHKPANLNEIERDDELIRLVEITVESNKRNLNENPLLKFVSVKTESLVTSTNCIPNVSLTNQHLCKICNLSFSENFFLVEHLYSHVDESQKFWNVISAIEETSKVSRQLHDNTNVCEESELKNQHNNHLNNTEHVCGYCERTFTGILELKKHYQIHISEKNRKSGQFENGNQTELNSISNISFSERKRKQRVPKRVLQVPDITDNYSLNITETRSSPNEQLWQIRNGVGANNQWKKTN